MSEIEKHTNAIARKTAQQVEREFPILTFSGFGGSLSENGVINYETLIFTTRHKLSKDEGVFVVNKIVDIYMKNIKSDEGMEGYLKEHSFDYSNLQVKLFVQYEDGAMVYHPEIGFFTLRNGLISYRTVTRSDEGYPKKETYSEEPFEVAAKRLGVWDGE